MLWYHNSKQIATLALPNGKWETYCRPDSPMVSSGVYALLVAGSRAVLAFLRLRLLADASFVLFANTQKGGNDMFSKLKLSLRNVNYKLYFALLILGFAPTIYNTVRVFFLGQLPGEWSYSIAGQLSWVNLLYVILN